MQCKSKCFVTHTSKDIARFVSEQKTSRSSASVDQALLSTILTVDLGTSRLHRRIIQLDCAWSDGSQFLIQRVNDRVRGAVFKARIVAFPCSESHTDGRPGIVHGLRNRPWFFRDFYTSPLTGCGDIPSVGSVFPAFSEFSERINFKAVYHCAGVFDQSEEKYRKEQIVQLQDFLVMRCGIKRERTRILRKGASPRFADKIKTLEPQPRTGHPPCPRHLHSLSLSLSS
ncbi:hypothetical protein TNCV_907411 [Trichonephila clavipes]|nr:hypothetical protein TNCV_907411 [Trichonephila clavipes]